MALDARLTPRQRIEAATESVIGGCADEAWRVPAAAARAVVLLTADRA